MRSMIAAGVMFLFLLAGCATGKKENLADKELGTGPQNAPIEEGAATGSTAQTLAVEAQVPAEKAVKQAKDPASLSKEDVQIALKNAGFFNGKIDGKFGPNTRKAIKEFQKANGLQADGLAGKKTRAALAKHL